MKEIDDNLNLPDQKEDFKEKKSYNYGDLVIMIWKRIKLKEKIPVELS